MKKNKTIDLFAGVGGTRLGFERSGFRTVFANDFDEKCKVTYNLNFKDPKLLVGDVREVNSKEVPDFDILLGGFPCQPFSIAGHRKGLKEKRGTLFLEIARILEEKKPLVFF